MKTYYNGPKGMRYGGAVTPKSKPKKKMMAGGMATNSPKNMMGTTDMPTMQPEPMPKKAMYGGMMNNRKMK